jgi:hypothetical protein
MGNQKTICRLAAISLAGALVTGCGASDAVSDYMGLGKYSPDETQVSTNQSLTMPPDLQLRAPGEGQPASAPAQQAFSPSQPVTTTPPQYGTVDPNQTYDATQPAQQVASVPTQPQTPTVTPGAATTETQDVYAKHGISKYRADGTEKSKAELNNELREVAKKRKQAQNPNYGTIFNLPNVWSD